MEVGKCSWTSCPFNENGVCHQTVHMVTINHPNYKKIYDQNSEEIKQHCRCLTPDLGQYYNRKY